MQVGWSGIKVKVYWPAFWFLFDWSALRINMSKAWVTLAQTIKVIFLSDNGRHLTFFLKQISLMCELIIAYN
jgi:hypothetical protein